MAINNPQNWLSHSGSLEGLGQGLGNTSTSNTFWIEDNYQQQSSALNALFARNPKTSTKKTFKQTLQGETDEWLKDALT